jgi:hypothetical protein
MKVNIDNIKRFKSKSSSIGDELSKVLFDGLYTSNFIFNYTNILGKNKIYDFKMSSDLEGTLLLFPSSLQHGVYPFYKCNDERISVSGNICLK